MSDYTRLDRGFVNWQGQRVFVPWIGALRIVPSAEGEISILKTNHRALIGTLAFFAFLFIAGRIGSPELALGGLAVAVAVFGATWVKKHGLVRRWPKLTGPRSGYWRFMIGYFRLRPVSDRLSEIGWKGFAAIYCTTVSLPSVRSVIDDAGTTWFPLRATLALIGPGLLAFLLSRDALIATMSMLPGRRNRSVEGSGYGA